MSDIRARFCDPAYLREREEYVRRRIERAAKIEDAIIRAKRGQPLCLLELIEPYDVREAIDAADLLPRNKKRGKGFTPLGQAKRDIDRMLERQRRAFGRVRYGSIPRLARARVLAMVGDGELPPDSDVAGIVKALVAKIHKGQRRTTRSR